MQICNLLQDKQHGVQNGETELLFYWITPIYFAKVRIFLDVGKGKSLWNGMELNEFYSESNGLVLISAKLKFKYTYDKHSSEPVYCKAKLEIMYL